MNSSRKREIILICIWCWIGDQAFARCSGKFLNPIGDVCWHCILPISIGGSWTNDAQMNYKNPICWCPGSSVPLPGIRIGLWEPARLVDVSREPFCFVSLGGIRLNVKVFSGTGGSSVAGENGVHNWHVHYYVIPLLNILGLLLNFSCGEVAGMEVIYLTELDPLWLDDELSMILNPEAAFFGGPIAQAACAADCLAATNKAPLNKLFWCAGCHGSMFPLTGNVTGDYGGLQTSLLVTERILFKMARQLLLWDTSSEEALCGPVPSPLLHKDQYRTQLTFPMAMNTGDGCKNIGASNLLYDTQREFPLKGESFGYLIWKRRNCCVF
jgi:conjugal transfer pilus assembly protein TraU